MNIEKHLRRITDAHPKTRFVNGLIRTNTMGRKERLVPLSKWRRGNPPLPTVERCALLLQRFPSIKTAIVPSTVGCVVWDVDKEPKPRKYLGRMFAEFGGDLSQCLFLDSRTPGRAHCWMQVDAKSMSELSSKITYYCDFGELLKDGLCWQHHLVNFKKLGAWLHGKHDAGLDMDGALKKHLKRKSGRGGISFDGTPNAYNRPYKLNGWYCHREAPADEGANEWLNLECWLAGKAGDEEHKAAAVQAALDVGYDNPFRDGHSNDADDEDYEYEAEEVADYAYASGLSAEPEPALERF